MEGRRVAITGIGLISALGRSRDEVWRGLIEGRCGIAELRLFDNHGYRSTRAAEMPAYGRIPAVREKIWRRMSRSDHTALLATGEALADSGVLECGVDPDRVAVVLGTGTGDMMRNEEWFAETRRLGLHRTRPSGVFDHFPSTPCDVVASHFGLGGLKTSVLSACSSSTVAIGYAGDAIRWGRADAAIAGASDVLCRLTFSGFNALRLVDTESCRPFCRTRKGMNIGEAAAILVLEEMSAARRRGARIYAELAGYALRCEAYHPTSPEPEGRAVATLIRDALRAAGVGEDDVDHVNAHGTATPHNDAAESRALHRVFGDRTRRLPVTSIKSMVGHCLAAAGAVEAAALALTIAHGVIPPTINYRERDPECDVDVVANEAREVPVTCGLSTSLAFGGNNAALVLRQVA